MRLDSKSARRIATGQLNTALNDACDSGNKVTELLVNGKNIRRAQASGRMRALINTNRATYGDFLIKDYWENRRYYMIHFDVADTGPTMQLGLMYESCNTRTWNNRSLFLANITMHAIERLMERRQKTELLALAREEFDLTFVNELIKCRKGQTNLWVDHETRLKTRNGWACGAFEVGSYTFVVKTWIHEPGWHAKTTTVAPSVANKPEGDDD